MVGRTGNQPLESLEEFSLELLFGVSYGSVPFGAFKNHQTRGEGPNLHDDSP